jgi:hypothetical protein
LRFVVPVLLLVSLILASCISDPTWGAPATALPGSSFNLTVGDNVKSVSISNGTVTITLKYLNGKAIVPNGTKPGLYDLIVETDEGSCYQHNAVWVTTNVASLTLMHLTDEHFGVFSPEGRWAKSYVLAAIIIANSNPKVEAIFVTGDIADTATPLQYREAKLVHGLSLKPVFMIPGNHDHVNPAPTYEELVGPRQWYRIIGGSVLVVGVDTGAEGYLTASQASFVSKVLSKDYPVKVLLHHHPLFAYLYGRPYVFKVRSWEELYYTLSRAHLYKSWLADEEGLKELVKAVYNSNLTLDLSGHIHLDSYAVVERSSGKKTWFVVTTTAGGPVRKGDHHGFKIISVSNNSVTVEGAGKPWDKNSSYSLEGATAGLNQNKVVSIVTFKVTDKRLLKLLPHLILAVPVPEDMKGVYKVFSPDSQRVWLKCTPAFCALYAETDRVELNKTYRLAIYTKADENAPTISDLNYPRNITVGTPITISFNAEDDAWGIQEVYAMISTPSYKLIAHPVNYGGKYKLSLPPIKTPGKANITLVLEDYYGHKTVKEISFKVIPKVAQVKRETPSRIPMGALALLALLTLILAAFLLI